MSDDDATAPAPEAPLATQARQRWQDFYGSLIEDVSRWATVRALVRALPETLPDALLMMDTEGTIVLLNNQLELMFGYHRSELIGKTPEFLLAPELREGHADLRRQYADAPHSRSMAMAANTVFRTRRKNGTELLVYVMLNPVATPDGIGTIAVIRRANSPGRAGGTSHG